MKLLSALLLAALAAGTVHAQSSGDDKKSSRNAISYSGGGIRGNQEVVADGTLVTDAEAKEFQGEQGYYEPPSLRRRSLLPGIEILRPTPGPDTKVKSPFAIAVQFRAQDAPIVPSSFKVLYGALKVDITERITKFVKVDANGFSFDNARIPPGKHKLTLVVQDEKQRTAERELRLEVE